MPEAVATAPLCRGAGLPKLAGKRIAMSASIASGTATVGVAFFQTALGVCGVAWNQRGIAGLQLPEASAAATRKRLRSRFPELRETPPPVPVQHACDAIVALLGGGKPDLSPIALDMAGVPEFDRRVYEIARAVPAGATTTYGAIAETLGEPGAARAVGQALGRNPFPIVVPCHRVLASGGSLGGFSAGGGVATKLKMLAIEGAEAASQRSLFD